MCYFHTTKIKFFSFFMLKLSYEIKQKQLIRTTTHAQGIEISITNQRTDAAYRYPIHSALFSST